MAKPLISVVIPTYNRSPSLRPAVESVLNQTHRDLELIVVDDCSKEPVASVLSDIRDCRMRVTRHNINMGVSAARNTGARMSHGKYLAFLDDDDTWKPKKLETQLGFMDRHAACVTDFTVSTKDTAYERQNSQRNPNWLIVTGTALGIGSAMLVDRDTFKEVGEFNLDMRRAEDWDWLLRFRKAGHKMAIVPEPLTVYGGAHHRANLDAEASGIRAINFLHRDFFSGNKGDARAFDAAIGWKEARIEINRGQIVTGGAHLAQTAVKHPIHFGRYLKTVFTAPVRRVMSHLSQATLADAQPPLR